jgi:AraC-like DNA-binding protein
MDIIWDGDSLFVAGPDTSPGAPAKTPFAVGIRFQPGAGPLFLDVPAGELRDRRVDLACLWRDTGQLEDALAACQTPHQAAALLEDWIARRMATVGEPDPIVEAAVRVWRRGPAEADVAGLARQAELTERQLHRRFVRAIGYGPRLLHRVLRFQRFLADCGTPAAGLAELAYRAGYADQAHLSRDTRLFAGRTPSELRAPRLPVRNVQDPSARTGYNSSMVQLAGPLP